jgi:hypothetical protein
MVMLKGDIYGEGEGILYRYLDLKWDVKMSGLTPA